MIGRDDAIPGKFVMYGKYLAMVVRVERNPWGKGIESIGAAIIIDIGTEKIKCSPRELFAA